jgi:hypothetical protein
MSTISPGAATNSGTAASTFESKTTDAHRSGKIVAATQGANASAAMAARLYEQRCAGNEGAPH